MISSNAQDSFDRIFRKAARSRLALHAEDTCDVATAAQGDAIGGEQAMILTITSIAFRLLLVLRFDEGERIARAVALKCAARVGASANSSPEEVISNRGMMYLEKIG